MNVWANLLDDQTFKEQIAQRGYSSEIKLVEYIKKHNLQKMFERAGAITANLLSIDFFSNQSSDLRKENLFLLRTGRGKFIVFNQNNFYSSYLNLALNNFEEINYEIPSNYNHLVQAYGDRLNENASLELMHFLGIFKKIFGILTGEEEYYIGPRGNKTSKFDVYMENKKEDRIEKCYTYFGQEELDYSLFSKKALVVIESKNLKNGGLDIGWHKLAYPLSRFRNLNLPIFPCYFLKQSNIIWLFLFPRYSFHNQGIILNNRDAIKPLYCFKLNLNKLSIN
jgi:hypothetical protein